MVKLIGCGRIIFAFFIDNNESELQRRVLCYETLAQIRVCQNGYVDDHDFHVTYGYDDLDQLTSATYTGGGVSDETYTYDANGNRTMQGYSLHPEGDQPPEGDDTPPRDNRLATYGTYTYDYDTAGNRVDRVRIADGEVTV